MSTSEKTEFIQKAKLAEQAERYEDMVSYMQKVDLRATKFPQIPF